MLRRTFGTLQSVLHREFPKAHLVTMNREKALNSLDMEMIELMLPLYRSYHKSPASQHVVILKGAGPKAFCAGGDVVSIVKDKPEGTQKKFFYREYQLDYSIMTLPQPHVALWNGIVMGGGVGVSVHGSHRVASEKAMFAMPETGIGLFPDVGGTWFLPRLKQDGLGLYLALTGQRLKGADLLHAGIATHFVPSVAMEGLENKLCNIDDAAKVNEVIASAKGAEALPAFSLEPVLPKIVEHFGKQHETLDSVLKSLAAAEEGQGCEWAKNQLSIMRKCCPTALSVSFALHRKGAKMTDPQEAFRVEYMTTQRIMKEKNFHSGVSALLIEKHGKPAWNPATLDEVTPAIVDSHFHKADDTPLWQPDGDFPTSNL